MQLPVVTFGGDFSKRNNASLRKASGLLTLDFDDVQDIPALLVELKAAKNEMGESKFRQEFECSFDAPIEGSYYGEMLNELEEKKHMQEIPREELSRTF